MTRSASSTTPAVLVLREIHLRPPNEPLHSCVVNSRVNMQTVSGLGLMWLIGYAHAQVDIIE